MGQVIQLHGQRVYLDANIFIYASVGFQPYDKVIEELFKAVDQGQIDAVTSELTIAECLVIPMRTNDTITQTEVAKAISSPGIKAIPVSRDILTDAARLRADRKQLKMPDAIHLATARRERCDILLTNDKGISDDRLLVMTLDDLI